MSQATPAAAQSGYADAASCAVCHAEIARSYAVTGMARSFSKAEPAKVVADFQTRNRLQHAPSGRHYAMLHRGGALVQRRHEIGFDGKETNVIEVEATYVVGLRQPCADVSPPQGRRPALPDARQLVFRTRPFEPLGASLDFAGGGFWAMSPGYDRPAHQDFRRVINTDCMACHNGYPRAAVQDDGHGPKFALPLPEGIDCQRCHGPGQAHVDAINSGNVDAGVRAIANPAKFERARQLDTCMQCHLEPTSSPLPFQIRRYEQPPFSYIPGKPLGDHFLYFDHAPGSGRDDKFEIASGAYPCGNRPAFSRAR